MRNCYLQIFSAKSAKLTEVTKLTQLPSDSYAVRTGFGGFIVLAPRQFIFKRQGGDLRFRFSALYEETEPDVEYLKELLQHNF